MLIILFLSFCVFLILGVPIAFSIGLSTMIALFFSKTAPLTIVVQRTYGLLDSYTLLAIPFFVLSGELMLAGGMSKRLVKFASVLVGHIRGGLAQVVILASMIFAGVSGSSTADASAIGSILIPTMKERGYRSGWIGALQASAATMGPIIPPSILMIVYGSLTGVSIGSMFLGGVIPGVLIGISLGVVVVIYSYLPGFDFLKAEKRASLKEVKDSFKDALLALVAPIIIIGGIVGGIFTATEAGIIATVYAFVVCKFVYKELKLRDMERLLTNAAVTSGVVLLIASMAAAFGWVLAWENFPQMTGSYLMSLTKSPLVVLLLVELFLLILTCFVETLAALIIFIPVLYQISIDYHIHPIYYGVAIVISLLVGQVTPPVGVLLYVMSSIAKCSFEDICRYIYPFIIPLVLVLFVITLLPQLITFIPSLFFK